jgi:DNA-binding XRE family transcriptional regulator
MSISYRKNKEMIMNDITTFEEHLDQRYGEIGSKKRADFELKAKAFAIGEILREARKEAHLTQEELALKTGTRKSFISRIENGHSDIQLSTLFRIVEIGFGKQMNLIIS